MGKIEKLLSLCKGRPVYVQAHNFPDPDALAAGNGLCRFLRHFEIPAVLFYDGLLDKRACKKMTEMFHVEAVPLKKLGPLPKEAVVVCVDSQKGAGNVTRLSVEVQACIDHHPTFFPAQYQYVDIRQVGACSTIIADYFYQEGLIPDEDTASALLYGIKIDTHQFSRGVSELDIEMFRFLKKFCDEEKLNKIAYNTMMYTDLKAYSSAIENIRIYGTMAFSEIEVPCSDDLIAMISDFFLSLDEIELCVVYCSREDGIKFSVRSELKEVHAGVWTKESLKGLGNGGGHAYMAGGMILAEHVAALGQYPDEKIQDRFLEVRNQMEDMQ